MLLLVGMVALGVMAHIVWKKSSQELWESCFVSCLYFYVVPFLSHSCGLSVMDDSETTQLSCVCRNLCHCAKEIC